MPWFGGKEVGRAGRGCTAEADLRGMGHWAQAGADGHPSSTDPTWAELTQDDRCSLPESLASP